MSGLGAEAAWAWSRARRARLLVYLWDLPPRGTGRGGPDPVVMDRRTLSPIPAPVGGYGRRRGYYSRLRYLARRADAVWTPSAMSAEIVLERFGVRAGRVPYCYDSIALRAVARGRHPPPVVPADAAHGLAARIAQEPGDRAAGGGRARPPGSGAPDRPRPRAGALESLASAAWRRLPGRDRRGRRRGRRAYREAAVAVCPSRFEGFGLTPIEAVAAGVPVVASDIPPHREFVGRAASLVSPDDDAAWAAAIARALDGPPADPSLVEDLTIPAAAGRFLASLRPLLQLNWGCPPSSCSPTTSRRSAAASRGGWPSSPGAIRRARWSSLPASQPTRSDVDADFPNRVDRLPIPSRRLRTHPRAAALVPARGGARPLDRRRVHLVRQHQAGRLSGASGRWSAPGTPFGILLHGGDLLILQHQVHQSAIKRQDRRARCSPRRRCWWPTASGPATAASRC